jgi:uncharacterized protein
MLRFTSAGRGRGYTRLRGGVESVLRVAYAGGWPAALWGRLPLARVSVTRHTLALLPEGSASLRVGFVSDLHLGPTTPACLVDEAFAHLAAAELDVLLLGGDYVFLDTSAAKERELARRVGGVVAATKLAVLGNHDLWTRHGGLERALADGGARILVNAKVELPPPHARVAIVGLDDPWTGHLDARAAFDGTDHADAIVVLCHSPDGFPEAARALARLPRRPAPPASPVPVANRPRASGSPVGALFVCGHTHGGHVATPWGPLIVPGRMGKRFPSGLFEVHGAHLFVSRGVGGIELPIRTFARPEVVIFDLIARGR